MYNYFQKVQVRCIFASTFPSFYCYHSMKKSFVLLTVITSLFLGSCGGEKSSQESTETSCAYRYQSAFTEIKWTAYKFTEKLGVSGRFDEFEVIPGADSGSIKGIVDGLTFSIPVASVNSDNPDRDAKIKAHFFGSMQETSEIRGKIVSVNLTDSLQGQATVEIVLNQQSQTIPMSIEINGLQLTLKGEIDLTQWNAQSSVDSLNQVCYDLHKGADGKSVLWPSVSLEVKSTLLRICPQN